MRVDASSSGILDIQMKRGDARCQVDEDKRTLSITFERQPYFPMGVFKCLVKMAIAVMPEEDAKEFEIYKRWILEPTHHSSPFSPLSLIWQMVPGPLPNDSVSFQLLRRMEGVSVIPRYTFAVQLSNAIYQIWLPFPEPGKEIDNVTFSVEPMPHPWGTGEFEESYGCSGFKVVDLNESGVKRGDSEVVAFGYETRTQVKKLEVAPETPDAK